MKKILSILAVFAVLMGSIFAETIGDNPDDPFERDRFENEKLTTQIIVPENQHCTDKNATVKIEYQPMHDELRIYYDTLYVTFDKGEAMNTVMACLQDFIKENKYYNYRYMEKDKIKSYKDDRKQRKTLYASHIKLTR
ncbi:hypothetical protein SAMN04487977_102251 [Treponema bryantii]|uniref:Uncharacterized protein n=1 Tax=Treponema bryantii TaxID=163 RepID=A0A1H9CQK2_9SPIR|nr:hypothetical protein [Treponema bryantii]BDC92353.1 hypothetical protein TRBR_04500 [Treponema bryantii]SEQ02888.1 hypothetical protein SAMN04487977_102251 [Treponema bryantii]